MEKKVIAIDVNEVIRDFRKSFAARYEMVQPTGNLLTDETKFDIDEAFPFLDDDQRVDSNLRHKFQYEDYAFEIYGRAKTIGNAIVAHMHNWIYNELCDYEPEENPDILIVSPLEGNLSIPATFSFFSRIALKCREFYFPVDSLTIWDRCDILITANPKLILHCPEGKRVIKINAPYNADVEAEYSFDTLKDLIDDPRRIVNHMLEGMEIPTLENKTNEIEDIDE